MTIMDSGAMALRVRTKIIATGGCAAFDASPLSRASAVCTLDADHGGGHRFEAITKVLLAPSEREQG